MTIFTVSLKSYVPGVFDSPAGQSADLYVVANIIKFWQEAEEMAAEAKAARFKLRSHRETYENARRQTGSLRAQATIDKHNKLLVNYRARIAFFELYFERIITNCEQLTKLIPELRDHARRAAEDAKIKNARVSNCVSCHRFLSRSGSMLISMAREFEPDHSSDIDGAGKHFFALYQRSVPGDNEPLYTSPLDIPFVFGLFDHPSYFALENCLTALSAAAAKAQQCHTAFKDAYSRYSNSHRSNRSGAGIASNQPGQKDPDNGNGPALDYQSARCALTMAQEAISHAVNDVRKALREVGSSSMSWNPCRNSSAFQANDIAVKQQMVAALKLFDNIKRTLETDEVALDAARSGQASNLIETALRSYPGRCEFLDKNLATYLPLLTYQ